MIKDFEISEQRSLAAKKGGGNPNLFKQNLNNEFKQNDKQNTEYENEYEIENILKGGTGGKFSKPSIEEVQEYYFQKCIEKKITAKNDN